MELKLNEQVEVSENKFKIFKKYFSHVVAYRKSGNKYFIKPLLWDGHKAQITEILKSNI